MYEFLLWVKEYTDIYFSSIQISILTLSVLIINGTSVHEYGHWVIAKKLDVKSAKILKKWKVIPHYFRIENQSEYNNLPSGKFILITFGGVLISLIGVLISLVLIYVCFKINWITKYSFYFFSSLMFSAGIIDYCKIIERFCDPTKLICRQLRKLCNLIEWLFK